ncbi:hypothetical protein HID58_043843 [Brassica napus]|uniref:Uncharacterized protein n=1 Tax=Brassica napus TaxID=3708 RepID=A0ABQ8BHN5_BRANA|nr:hypothetical protein HID58_043843 [Brassica napus]
MESTGKSPVSSYRKPKRKILSSSAISKTPTGKSVAASEIAIKPNGKTAVSSAIPRSQSSSAHGDDVMFFRDVTMRPHQEELRFRLIHFWEARNPNTKTLTGVEMLLIDEQVRLLLIGNGYSRFYLSRTDSPVPFQEDWFRFRSHEEFEANCDLKVDLYDYLGHMKLVNEQPLTDCPILNGVDIAKKRHLRVHVQTRGGPLMKLYIWDKAAADFCLKYKSYGRTPSAILVTTLNPKRIGGTLARLLCHLHGFLWTLMSNQQEIILAGMLGSNSDIAWKINAEIVTKPVAVTIAELFSYIKHENANMRMRRLLGLSAQQL